MVVVGRHLFLHGGIGSHKFSNFSTMNLATGLWEELEVPVGPVDAPAKRYGHTVDLYRENFVIFGGAGNYIPKLKLRENFCDLAMFNYQRVSWTLLDRGNTQMRELVPEKRMYHGAAVLGSLLLVFGGINTEDKQVFGDLKIYDCEKRVWVRSMQPKKNR